MMMDSPTADGIMATLPVEQTEGIDNEQGVNSTNGVEALSTQNDNRQLSGAISERRERGLTSNRATSQTHSERSRTIESRSSRQRMGATSLADGNASSSPVISESSAQDADSDNTVVDSRTMQLKAQANNREVNPQSRSLEAATDLLPLESESDLNVSRSPLPVTPAEKIKVIEEESTTADQSLAVEFRKGVVSQHFADNSARKIQTQFVNDMFREDFAAGAYYSPDTKWQFGIEGGRERYTQSLFYNQNDSVLIEQRPNITWLGLAVSRQMELLEMPIFLQGTLGASTDLGGPLVRGRVGTNLLDLMNTSVPFSVPLSVDVSSLVYTFNGQYLVTGNWGVNLGIRYDFGF